MEPSERLSRLALNRADFLQPRERLWLLESLGTARKVLSLSRWALANQLGRRVTAQWQPSRLVQRAERDAKDLTEGRFGCTFWADADYPPQLYEIHDPPLILFYRGRLPSYDKPMIAVVGTRKPTGAARKAAYGLGHDTAREHITVVSGLAMGIDAHAHRGALDGGGGTCAVLGNGIDTIYPRSHSLLAGKIIATGGAIVTEFSPGTPPLRYNFPARNRIISGLCRSVVVVQAPLRSGALITAEYALNQGRDLYVHADGTDSAAGAGTRALVESGAPVIQDARCVLKEWDWPLREGVAPRLAQGDTGAWTSVPGDVGQRLARQLELELSGKLSSKNGEMYWH